MSRKLARIAVPPEINFAELDLHRHADNGDLSFRWEPIDHLCAYNRIDPALIRRSHEDTVAGLITAWYAHHLQAGGARNAVADQLIAEAMQEAADDATTH